MTAVPVRRLAIGPGVPVPADCPWTLDVLGRPAFAAVVRGEPGPQGSKSGFIRQGKVVMVESSKKVEPWRKLVAATARGITGPSWVPLNGPLIADMVFTWAKPKGSKAWEAWHPRYPDLDKLLRSTFDGMSAGKVWADDARVVALRRAEKLYEGSFDTDALPKGQIGAVIRVWTLPEALEQRLRDAAAAR